MAVAGCAHVPAALAVVPVPDPHAQRVAPAAHVLVALAVVLVALAVVLVVARVPVALAVVLVVVALVAMARAVAAEGGHMAVAMATDHRQPRHARRQPPSSRAGRSRCLRRSSSRIWRRCSMFRSMKSSAT